MPPYSERVLTEFIQKERSKVFAFLQKNFSLQEADCEDVFQDSLLVLYDKIMEGKLTKVTANISTYFFSICKNKAFEKLRERGHYVHKAQDYDIDYLDEVKEEKLNDLLTLDPDKSLIEAKEAITRQIVRDLPKPCDDILWGGYFRDGYKLRTLADMLSSTEDSIKVRKHRCQEKFRLRWKQLVKNLF